jgi:hypothetical protein
MPRVVKDAEGGVVHDAAVFGLGSGQILIELTEVRFRLLERMAMCDSIAALIARITLDKWPISSALVMTGTCGIGLLSDVTTAEARRCQRSRDRVGDKV